LLARATAGTVFASAEAADRADSNAVLELFDPGTDLGRAVLECRV
jgi:hypothetical protein